MTRTLFAALLLIAPTAALASGKQQPPDSIEPRERPGKVTFSHKKERTISCTAKTKQPKADADCEAKREAMDASTRIELLPVPAPNLVKPDQRKPVTLDHPRDGKEVSAELGVGVWELVWAGRSQRERFRVNPDAPVKIQLQTTRGHCAAQSALCRLNASSTRHQVTIPAQHRVN
ncbi:MAG: hypothetical protein KIT72_01700 [Polyangiaceae bacterium]|nr:hypothetical protein [Polyangiaceae bacterium]MCW5789112.1 hypothetical protein [Polyangiaceae bacterium]